MPGWMKHKLESRLPRKVTVTSDKEMTPPLKQKAKRNKRASWWKWKRRVKNWLKTQHSKTKIMPSSPITSWQIDGETMETVTDFIFLGWKITPDGDSSHEVKKRLLLGRKGMTHLDNILKSRDITLLTNVSIVKVMVFQLVTYGCESWTIKKTEWVSDSCSVMPDSLQPLEL